MAATQHAAGFSQRATIPAHLVRIASCSSRAEMVRAGVIAVVVKADLIVSAQVDGGHRSCTSPGEVYKFYHGNSRAESPVPPMRCGRRHGRCAIHPFRLPFFCLLECSNELHISEVNAG
jgi:hypothetical protein